MKARRSVPPAAGPAGLRARLAAGDMRQTGAAGAIAAEMLVRPQCLPELLAALEDARPGVRMRAADALEKVSAAKPALVQPHGATLLKLAANATQQELRWHLAQMIGRLDLTPAQAKRAAAVFAYWLAADDSRIVRVMALQAVADMARSHPTLRPQARALCEQALNSPFPAVRARARKLAGVLRSPATGRPTRIRNPA
jgi:hypothetical protein